MLLAASTDSAYKLTGCNFRKERATRRDIKLKKAVICESRIDDFTFDGDPRAILSQAVLTNAIDRLVFGAQANWQASSKLLF